MARGDHISVRRPFMYAHHGIDLGDGTVVHMTGAPSSKRGASVQRSSVDEFTLGGVIRIHEYSEGRYDSETTVERALSRLGTGGYDLVANNCEHFACWCATGQSGSVQVTLVAATTQIVGGSSLAAAGTITVVSAAGAAGLSGPGIMSGLAAIGSAVGAGAVGGLTLAAAAPALASTFVMNRALKDDTFRTDGERAARTVGRTVTNVTAVVSVLGAIKVVGAAGYAGFSGPGIASGLATIGGTVGGGMVAGTVLTVGLPALLAALLGYAAYRLARWAGEQGGDLPRFTFAF